MRILLALAIVLAGCSKKKEEAAPTPAPPASKPEEAKPMPVVDEKPTPTESEKPTPIEPATPDPTKPDPAKPDPANADSTKRDPAKPVPAAGAPTKAAAIQRLRDVLAVLESKDYTKATELFAFPANERPRSAEAAFGKLIEQKEISAKGIDVLAAKGKYGKLADVFGPEKAASYVEKYVLPLDECYGLSVDGASVGFHWDGVSLKLFRLDDVGKLE
jgi:hypothetical protein